MMLHDLVDVYFAYDFIISFSELHFLTFLLPLGRSIHMGQDLRTLKTFQSTLNFQNKKYPVYIITKDYFPTHLHPYNDLGNARSS